MNVNQSNYTNFDPTKHYKRTNFCTRCSFIFDLSMFIALLSTLLIIMSRPNKPRPKTKPSNSSVSMNVQSSSIGVVTEKVKSSQTSHSLNLQSSSVALQTATIHHSQLTSHLLSQQSPATAPESAKLKPSEKSVSFDLQSTSLATEPALTNSLAIETSVNNQAFATAHHQNKPHLPPTLPSKDTLAIQHEEPSNPLQTSDQLLHSSPTSKASLPSNVVRKDQHFISTSRQLL